MRCFDNTRQNGNASLTHIDSYTDLSFIENELNWMQGACSIHIVQPLHVKGDLTEKIQQHLRKHSTNYTLQTTSDAVLLRNKDVLCLCGKDIDTMQDNKEATLYIANEWDVQRRIYVRQLNTLQKNLPESPPQLAYDGQSLQDVHEELHPRTEKLINDLMESKLPIGEFVKSLHFNEVDPRKIAAIQHSLGHILPSYMSNLYRTDLTKSLPEPTQLTSILNTKFSPLIFSSRSNNNNEVDAVAAVNTNKSYVAAQKTQEIVHAGMFYWTGEQTLFVLPKINVNRELGEKIQALSESSLSS
ncbi:MAG: hypothetical protein WCW01_03085 [Gammaproteobacteria bacterium]